jgi:hypothetical protein
MESATELEAPRREAKRKELVDQIPGWYSPWVHLAFPTVVGLTLIGLAIWQLREPTWLQLLFLPAILIVSNATEWRLHRDILHKRTRPFELIFDRHTPEHHAVYVCDDMAIRSTKEFRLVLIPAYGIVTVFLGTSPITLALYFLGQWNLACLFVIATMSYVVSYEWFHLSYHMPPESFVGRRWLVRVLRRHHATHHRPELMQKWNFNVTLPLWDLVRGTIYRGA